jgi:hypothetical protein
MARSGRDRAARELLLLPGEETAPMTLQLLQTVQLAKIESSIESENQGKDALEAASQDHQDRAHEAYAAGMRRVEEARCARDTKNLCILLGTLIGSPGIGTAIGLGIGEAADDAHANAAADAERDTGRADQLTERAKDAFDDARDDLGELRSAARAAESTGRDLRDDRWIGIA